jgi:hypothetical protein
MIKLKDLLLEGTAPDIFVPRRMEDRLERMISLYIRNGSKGNLVLRRMNLNELPEILKNVSVDGSFDCENNKLTSLTNAPKFVGGTFYCGNNELTSLEFAPTSVGRNFDCSHNELTSLEFAPKTVGGFFDCRYNPVKFTEKQVRAVCNVKGDVYV